MNPRGSYAESRSGEFEQGAFVATELHLDAVKLSEKKLGESELLPSVLAFL